MRVPLTREVKEGRKPTKQILKGVVRALRSFKLDKLFTPNLHFKNHFCCLVGNGLKCR